MTKAPGILLTVAFIAALGACNAAEAEAEACGDPAPTTAEGYRAQLDGLDSAEWGGADQATTVLLPDGRNLWLFGDTVGPGYFSHNSLIVQDGGCLDVIRPAIPDRGDGSYYWPSHGAVDGGEARIFTARISDSNGSFVVDGTEIARFSLPGLQFLGMAPTPSLDRPDTSIHWGASVVRSGGYVYVYGNQKIEGPWVFGKAGYLARVPAGKLTQLNKWRYWTGSGWSASEASAVKVLDEHQHLMSTNWSTYRDGGQWVIVHKEADVFGDTIVSLRSANPFGPWTRKALVQVPPWTPEHATYNAAAHPQLGLASGRTLVSLSHNDERVFEDNSLYRPEFFELDP